MDKIETFVDGINSRSLSAFDLLFKLHYRELVYFSGIICNSIQDAEDIVHDVLLQLWESSYIFENHIALRSFLYTSTKNRTINFVKRHNKQINDVSFLATKDNNESIIGAIIDAEVLSLINLAIDRLPSECAKVMKLILQGYSSAEISVILDLAQSTVRAQKRRGLSLLRQYMPKDAFIFFITFFKIV